MKHRDAAREFYRQGKFQEGWEYVLQHQDAFPKKKLTEMWLAFAEKIFDMKKRKI